MAARAKVRSIEALEAFRNSLIRYLEKASAALDEVNEEVVRTKQWLQHDCPAHWRREAARRERVLQRREQELFSARLSDLQDDTAAQQMAVARARRALEEAEAKLRCARGWSRRYESRVEPLARRVDQLRHLLARDMARAVQQLSHAIRTLETYAEVGRPAAPSGESRPPAANASGEATSAEGGSAANGEGACD